MGREVHPPQVTMRICSVPGCPEIYPGDDSRCPSCRKQGDRARGTATERGYTSRGHQIFRRIVLERDPICVECRVRPSTVADHYPHSRRDLLDAGLNPNDPRYGRGLCLPCHSRETTKHQPGGFLNRD